MGILPCSSIFSAGESAFAGLGVLYCHLLCQKSETFSSKIVLYPYLAVVEIMHQEVAVINRGKVERYGIE